jgi:hypothetical protein
MVTVEYKQTELKKKHIVQFMIRLRHEACAAFNSRWAEPLPPWQGIHECRWPLLPQL